MSEIISRREAYLASLDEEKRAVTLAMWKEKARESRKKSQEIKKEDDFIAERMRMALQAEYVVFDDGEERHTVMDEIIATTVANELKNPKLSFRDLKDLQSVINSDDDKDNGGVNIVVVTNGQDLGE